MQAHDMPFTKLINVDQGAREHFHVPKYQREYTWKKWQWEQLLNDIEDNDPGYFMGSIICVNDMQSITAGDPTQSTHANWRSHDDVIPARKNPPKFHRPHAQ